MVIAQDLMIRLSIDNIISERDRALVTSYLEAHRDRHNGDIFIDRTEALDLLDQNRNGIPGEFQDWQKAYRDNFLISRRAYADLVGILKPLLSYSNIGELRVEDTLEKKKTPAFSKRDIPIHEDKSYKKNPVYKRLKNTGKADIHIHFGGNVATEFLYEQAIARVGRNALDPRRWGGKVDWAEEQAYTNYHNFQKLSLDDVVRIAVAGKSLSEAEFIPPSKIVARGQEIRRELQSAKTSDERIALQLREAENKINFANLAVFKPHKKTKLEDVFNIYRIRSSLVERTESLSAQAAAVQDALREFSEDNVRYAEIRIGAPKARMALKQFPKLDKEEAFLKVMQVNLTNIAAAIKEGNKNLVNKGFNPVDLRIIVSISKSASRSDDNLAQLKALVRLLREEDGLVHYIVGIDGAAKEAGEKPNLYKEHFDVIKKYNESVPRSKRLGITWHQGEDFSDTSMFDSIRRVCQLIEMGVDRIGHGLVLGMDPKFYLGKVFHMDIDDYLDYLEFESKNKFLFPVHLAVEGAKRNLGEEIARASDLKSKGDEKIVGVYLNGRYSDFMKQAIRERQKFVLKQMREKGVVLDMNPTSNRYMALRSGLYEDHPFPFILNESVRVTINTDDAGIFDTDLNRELVYAALMAGLSEDQLLAIVREGFSSSFASKVRGESLEHLR